MNPFLHKIEAFVAHRHLLNKSERYLVALSGGADSVCLLRVMLALGYLVEGAHCNFHLRDDESDRDEAFCKDLCKRLGVTLHVTHFDTLAYSKERKISIEMAARELRYNYFENLIRENAIAGVLVAHHKNDAMETFMLNLTRGTGIDGLKGISAKNGHILRPLLAVTREEIVDYLNSIGQDYVFDSTNGELEAQRNVVRLKVMPILKQLNPKAEDNILHTLELVEGSLELLRTTIEEAKNRVATTVNDELSISIERLLQETSAEIILWELLKGKGFSSQQVAQIYDNIHSQTGKQWSSSTHSLLINRGLILIRPAELVPQATHVPTEGSYVHNNVETFTFKIIEIDTSFDVLKEPNSVSLDADTVTFPLTIRHVQRGDDFVPFGMKGRKLLSDYLTDKKLSLFDKRQQLVVTDSKERILWVVGLRADNRFRISETSKRALIITKNRLLL